MARGHRREVSRVEGFSDAVFAFAITLLVVSLEVPKTFDELLGAIRGFPAFAICFALLFQVWWRHYQFFRNYDLEDTTVISVTGALLFVVLFYVYPLKFVWSITMSSIGGRAITEETVTQAQVPLLFVIYGAGVVAVFSLLAALYGHAFRKRAELELTPAEALDARVNVYRNLGYAAVGGLSIAVALLLSRLAPRAGGLAGYAYFGIGLIEWIVGAYHRQASKRLR